jgi:excisionase family DNA binding protein
MERLRRKQDMSINVSRNEPITYAEIGRVLGISRERVRQIANRNTARNKKPTPVAMANSGLDTPSFAAEKMLTVRDVANFLHLHTNTVRRWSNEGRLQAIRMGPRGDRRFPQENVLRLISKEL